MRVQVCRRWFALDIIWKAGAAASEEQKQGDDGVDGDGSFQWFTPLDSLLTGLCLPTRTAECPQKFSNSAICHSRKIRFTLRSIQDDCPFEALGILNPGHDLSFTL